MTENLAPDRWLDFEGVQRTSRASYLGRPGFRLIEIDGERHWLPESEMQIIEHDELLDTIKFRITKNAARKGGLIK